MAKSFHVYDKNFNQIGGASALGIGDTFGDICFLSSKNGSITFASASTTELVIYEKRIRSGAVNRLKVLWTATGDLVGRGVCSVGKHLILVTRDPVALTAQHRGVHPTTGDLLFSSGKGNVEIYGICWDGRFLKNIIDLANDAVRTYWLSGKSSTAVDNFVLPANGHKGICFDGKNYWLAPRNGLTFKQISPAGRLLKASSGTTWPDYDGIMTDGKNLYCAAAA